MPPVGDERIANKLLKPHTTSMRVCIDDIDIERRKDGPRRGFLDIPLILDLPRASPAVGNDREAEVAVAIISDACAIP